MTMVTSFAVTLTVLLAVMLLPQAVLTAWFVCAVRERTRDFLTRDAQRRQAASVPAEVVLCLRGCDATLTEVFAALARQSHRSWRLRVVVDSVDDPAWDAAHHAISEHVADAAASWHGHVVESLASRPVAGSLKCASLRQALRALAPDTQVIAVIDADAVVHADWLVTLVDECLRPGVGAVSGNRWYCPHRDAPAAIVRALWNAGAIVQMAAFGIPWGGSLAVRREALEASRWIDVIESTLCEDTALARPLARAGWAYRYLPTLTAIDRDDHVAFGPLTRWIARQLITARLHHPAWPLVAMHGIVTSLLLAVSAVAAPLAWACGGPRAAAALSAAFVTYEVVNVMLAAWIAAAIGSATAGAVVTGTRAATGQPPAHWSGGRLLRWAAFVPATQCVYAAAMVWALLARTVEWRGVIYEFQTQGDTHRVTIANLTHPQPDRIVRANVVRGNEPEMLGNSGS
jgi:hypothetical protein